jgi:hypothetical protein
LLPSVANQKLYRSEPCMILGRCPACRLGLPDTAPPACGRLVFPVDEEHLPRAWLFYAQKDLFQVSIGYMVTLGAAITAIANALAGFKGRLGAAPKAT